MMPYSTTKKTAAELKAELDNARRLREEQERKLLSELEAVEEQERQEEEERQKREDEEKRKKRKKELEAERQRQEQKKQQEDEGRKRFEERKKQGASKKAEDTQKQAKLTFANGLVKARDQENGDPSRKRKRLNSSSSYSDDEELTARSGGEVELREPCERCILLRRECVLAPTTSSRATTRCLPCVKAKPRCRPPGESTLVPTNDFDRIAAALEENNRLLQKLVEIGEGQLAHLRLARKSACQPDWQKTTDLTGGGSKQVDETL